MYPEAAKSWDAAQRAWEESGLRSALEAIARNSCRNSSRIDSIEIERILESLTCCISKHKIAHRL